jgi:eukaryotic-like serine/threonine-protein kinase
MAGDPLAPSKLRDLEQAQRIHSFCEEFETSSRAGASPRIEEYLERAPETDRTVLLRELLFLDVELKRDCGEVPSPEDFRSRFPDAASDIDAALAEGWTTATSFSPVGPTREKGPPILGSDVAPTAFLPPRPDDSSGSLARADGSFGWIGEYEILEEIARGGMGVVYKARQKPVKRLVALKMILTGQMASNEERERFLREAELAANLDHPNIVPIYEVSEFQGCPFFSMKLVEGQSLSRLIKQKNREDSRYDPEAAAQLTATLARAVHFAHVHGFMHCDLKPSNILLERDGRPYVTDFGLAKRASEDSSLSISGAILGTPSYMAPEQASGGRKGLSPATDVYGLGAILYELLTGEPPFRNETVMETVVEVLERDPVPPRELRTEVPKELETICLKCLEKDPHARYPSAEALALELERHLQGEVIDTTALLPRLRRWHRREPELIARLGGLCLVALLSQFNYYFISAAPDFRHHYTIQGVLALWAVSAVIFQVITRAGWQADRVRVFWSAADILFVTIEIKLFEFTAHSLPQGEPVVRVVTTLLVGYPILVAASGLWWRVWLVWVTTAMTMLAVAWLHADAALWLRAGKLEWNPSPDLEHVNIFLAGLLLIGYVVARQVKRILLLSQYYEHRPNA